MSKLERIVSFSSPVFAALSGVFGVVFILVPEDLLKMVAIVVGVIFVLLAFGMFYDFRLKKRTKRGVYDEVLKILVEGVKDRCVVNGDWRVTVLREEIDSGKLYLRRIYRFASHHEYSDGGMSRFLAQESVMQGLHAVTFGDSNAPPVNQRDNFPDNATDPVKWLAEQYRFVKSRAYDLRMKSRVYVWRRVIAPPGDTSQNPYVLLIESTMPGGVSENTMRDPILDSIVHAIVRVVGIAGKIQD